MEMKSATVDSLLAVGLPLGVAKELLDTVNSGSYQDVTAALELAASYLTDFGVTTCYEDRRWVSHYYQNIIAEYVNTGDTYTTTILYDTENQTLHVTSLGDWYEEWEAKMIEAGEIEPYE